MIKDFVENKNSAKSAGRERSRITKMEMSQRTVGRISRWIVVVCAFALAMAMGITAWATAEPGTTIYIAEGKNDVNIRSQASTSSDPVGQLDGGAALTVVSVISADGHNWYEVECVIGGETKTGYIRDDLVEIPEGGGDAAGTGEPAEGGQETPEGEAPEGGAPEGGAPEGETPTPEGDGTAAPSSGLSGIGDLTPVDSEAELQNMPAGFRSLVIEINGIQIPAWADDSNEYFIFYATTSTGNTGWYLYDKISGGYVRYGDFMGSGAALSSGTVSANGDGISKTAFVIVIVICILLVAATAVMGIKLMNGGGRDDYDDYDDDDDYDDEEDEGPRARSGSVFKKFSGRDDDDDYEDEEDYDDEDDYDDRRRRPARQTHQVAVQQPVRTARPVGEGRPPVQSRPASQGRPPVQGRPAGGTRQPVSQGRPPVSGGRPAGQQGQPSGGMARPAGQQPSRPSGGAAQGQQRYAQRQAGQQRYAQRTTATRRDDEY